MNGGWDYSKALFPVDFSVDCSNKNHQKRSSMVQPEAVLVCGRRELKDGFLLEEPPGFISWFSGPI